MYTLFAALPFAAAAPSVSESTKTALLGVVGVIASALIGYFTARYAAKRSAQASREQVKVTERQVDVGEWKSLVETLQSETARLGGRVEDLENKDKAKNDRINELERKEEEHARKYAAAIRYIGVLLTWRANGANTNPPTAPIDIALDLNK